MVWKEGSSSSSSSGTGKLRSRRRWPHYSLSLLLLLILRQFLDFPVATAIFFLFQQQQKARTGSPMVFKKSTLRLRMAPFLVIFWS